jgi:hypothetical protein
MTNDENNLEWRIGKKCVGGWYSPFSTNDDFLGTLKFELGSSQGFLCMWSNNIFTTHKQHNLAHYNLSTNTLWLTKRSPHVGLQTTTPTHDIILLIRNTWKGTLDTQITIDYILDRIV